MYYNTYYNFNIVWIKKVKVIHVKVRLENSIVFVHKGFLSSHLT